MEWDIQQGMGIGKGRTCLYYRFGKEESTILFIS
jgi:hypothetical protein